MTPLDVPQKTPRGILHTHRRRIATAIVGIVCVTVSLAADEIGLDSSGTFGRGEVLLLVAGLLLLTLAAIRKPITTVYTAVSVVALNTALLFALVELGAVAYSTVASSSSEDRVLPSYYAEQPWSSTYWREHVAANRKTFEPYAMWRRRPFEGETITIDADGIRRTPGLCGSPTAQVFAFGGSALWGWGAPDSLTIPAYLVRELRGLTSEGPCVTNFGEDGYVSTQEVITLYRRLQAGAAPRVVVFYHGANDVVNFFTTGRAGVHLQERDIRSRLDHGIVRRALEATELFSILQRARTPETVWTAARLEQAAGEIVDVYLANYRAVAGLAEAFDFDFFFFWQPMICAGGKLLTEGERAIRQEMEDSVVNLCDAVYRRIERIAPSYDHLHYLADVFDTETSQLWMDPLHVTPVGNRLAAERMGEIIQERLRGAGPSD